MTINAQLVAMEESISRLLPGSDGHDRRLLLAELASYSAIVVRHRTRSTTCVARPSRGFEIPQWILHPIFVCGAHRSGTTLMQRLLDSHPQLLVLPSEGTYFSSFRYAARPDPTPQDIDRFLEEWISRLVDPNSAPHFRLGRGTQYANPSVSFSHRLREWQTVLSHARPELAEFSLLMALAAAFKDVACPRSTARMWVEKTPRNETHIGRLLAFEHARFIHLVREPAATLSSLRAARRIAGYAKFNSRRHIQEIGQSLRLARRHTESLRDRYLVVRYEDLTGDPAQEMTRVCRFLRIDADSSMLMPTAGGTPVESNSSFERTAPGVIAPRRSTASVPPDDERAIGVLVGLDAKPFGYAVASVTLADRAAVQIRRLSEHLLHRRVWRS